MTRRYGRIAAAIVAIAAAFGLAAACAPSLADLAWVRCSWASFEASPDPRGAYDRAVLLVPVSFGRVEAYVQLDTGATNSWLERDLADHLGIPYEVIGEVAGWPPGQGRAWRAVVRDFGFSSLRLPKAELLLLETAAGPARDAVLSRMGGGAGISVVIGTVGVDLFQRGCLVLDLQEGRAAFSRAAPRLDGVTVPLVLVGGRPVFHLDAAGSLWTLYDTGASAFGLVCRPELFRQLASEDAGWVLPVTVIGGVGELRGARVELTLAIGSEAFRLTEIYTMEMMDLLCESTGGRIEAIAGNELFRGRVVVVDFARRRLVVGPPRDGLREP